MSDQLLRQIVEVLRQDESVRAVWLAGSRGRGTSDEFSDIDIWVAIDDDAMPAVVNDPLAFIHGVVPTIMHVIAPEIAPTGGAFLGSWVPQDGVFVQVDWYLTPARTARRAADTQMVFGNVSIEKPEPAVTLSKDIVVAKIRDNLVLAMLMISNMVKHARRDHIWRAVDHAKHVDNCLLNARWFLDYGVEPDFLARHDSFLPELIRNDSIGFQDLGYVLLGTTECLVERAGLRDELAQPVAAMHQVINGWRESDWLPEDSFYRSLPRRRLAAGVLITDMSGDVLLLEPTYKSNWEIPGGVCEEGESPRSAVFREVKEELGVTLTPGRLLVFDHRSEPEPKGDAIMLVYDGRELNAPSILNLNRDEIAGYKFVPADQLEQYALSRMATRLRAAIRARRENRLIEIENGIPVN